MKSKLFQAAVLLLLVVLIGLVFCFGWRRYVEYAARQALHAVSRRARDITAVEVLQITGNSGAGPAGSYYLRYDDSQHPIVARHLLTGAQASALVEAWGHVRFVEGIFAACHSPGFVLRFMAGKSKVFEAAVCFDCENISYEPAPFESACIQMSPTSFDPKSGIAELKMFLTQLQ